MERRWLLLVLIAVPLLASGLSTASALDQECELGALREGECVSAGLGSGSVDLRTDNSTVRGGSGNRGVDKAVAPGRGDDEPPEEGVNDPREVRDMLGTCQDPAACGRSDARVITLSDLTSFAPATPEIRMEPYGWMVRGLPANFIADAETNSTDGSLFDSRVTVRFTPTAYNWEWGDGSSDTVTVPGATWEDLSLPRFSHTETSHVFEDRGPTSIGLTVDYTVDVSLEGGEWITIAGTVAASTTVDATVVTGKTVLVDGDCSETSADPGC